MILGGQCVNAFCATRPPGHHAGRELHPMKAISNGFCILNTAACAALYATTPLSEHGPGLKRVSQSGRRLNLAPRMDVTLLFILVRANRHSFCSCYFRFASLTLMSTMETELKVRYNSLRKKNNDSHRKVTHFNPIVSPKISSARRMILASCTFHCTQVVHISMATSQKTRTRNAGQVLAAVSEKRMASFLVVAVTPRLTREC